MPSAELCSRDEVKAFLGITGATYDAAISRLVTAASEAVERHCRRRFALTAYTEYHDGGGKDRIVLLERPVTVMSQVWDDPEREFEEDALLGAEEYVVDSARGILELRSGRFFDGKRNVKVSYTAGYGAIPEDVTQAAVLLAARWFREGRETARAGESAELPGEVRALLRPYREAVV